MMVRKSVLVTGANGYIGSAVCRAFVRAGWRVYGLVRKPQAMTSLRSSEVVPILTTYDDLDCVEVLFGYSKTFDVIVGCSEALGSEYIHHFNQVLKLIRRVSEESNANSVRPLVLWSSGCKDYGTTPVDGAQDLAPHTEESDLHPPSLLETRASYSPRVFDEGDLFDAAVLRPTNVFGYSSSFYGALFEFAANAAAVSEASLKLRGVNPRSIMHSLHVDDCAEAYVALAEHPRRQVVAGQCFNISGSQYETAGAILAALAKEYDFPAGAEFVTETSNEGTAPSDHRMDILCGFSQWVSSEKLRTLTGWTDKRLPFTENLGVYRSAFETTVAMGHEDVRRVEAGYERFLGKSK